MSYLHPVAAVPNELIQDKTLHYTTKKVALVLLLVAGRKNRSTSITIRNIARFAKCSTTTVQQAIRELVDAGYITKQRKYRYGEDQNHLIYDANCYLWTRRNGGYTLVKREIMNYRLTSAAFVNLLFLYRCGGCAGRAFPSLRQIAGLLRNKAGLDMSKSTVCKAINELNRLIALIRLRCEKTCGCYATNSYLLTDLVVSSGTRGVFKNEGSPIFDKPMIIT